MFAVTTLLLALVVPSEKPVGRVHAAPPVVTIRAKDYALIAPKSIKSGPTTFHLVNEGKELHHVTILKLAKGKTLADFGAAMKNPGPPPTWVTEVGGPNPALPNGSVDATLNLDAGEYVLICFINTPGEKAPHAAKGMVAGLTVLPESNGSTALVGDNTVHVSDYKFTFAKPLTAGHHVIDMINDGPQPHEIVFVELAPGKTIGDVSKWVEKDAMKGPPPGKPVGGMAGMAKGRSGSFVIDLKPGRYGLICFVPDSKDGKGHSEHGMTSEITVK